MLNDQLNVYLSRIIFVANFNSNHIINYLIWQLAVVILFLITESCLNYQIFFINYYKCMEMCIL